MTAQHSNIWLIIVVVALGTFTMRFSFIGLLKRGEAPRWLTRLLRFVPPAILAALATVSVAGASMGEAGGIAPIVAASLGLAVATRTRNLLVPIATGMVVLWTMNVFT